MKKDVATKKRRIRCAAPARRTVVIEEYLKAKHNYKEEIEKAVINSWKSFCRRARDRESLWDGIYRVIKRTNERKKDQNMLKKDGRVLTPEESAQYLAETLFPEDTKKGESREHSDIRSRAEKINNMEHNANYDPLFTHTELTEIVASFNPKKAPGEDGFTADICGHAISANPSIYLTLANKCLTLGYFPARWKKATVIILRKPDREAYDQPKAYRPIGLLPVLGKIMEKMIVKRLNWHLIPRMSERQYGFVPQKGTEDALYTQTKHIREAVVEPVILYAASAWSPSVSKLYIKKRLDSVQRGFAAKICKAHKTASLNSVRVLAGLLPLDLRVVEEATLFKIKKGHDTLEVLKDVEIELKTPYQNTPHPAKIPQISYRVLANEEVNNEDKIHVYTDGSKTSEGVGWLRAAVTFWRNDREILKHKLTLAGFCSVYQAELLALKKAVHLAVRRKEVGFNIFSDARSALDAITSSRSLSPLVTDIREVLGKHPEKEIKLFWVKAHAGREGNERADELAKEATKNHKNKPSYDRCPLSHLKRLIRAETLQKWATRYKNEQTGKITKMFFPDAIAAYKIIRNITFNSTLSQILTGHGGFSAYLYRFKLKESPTCICGYAEEDVPHILFDCPVHLYVRMKLENQIDVDKIGKCNIASELAKKDNRKTILQYCIEIGTLVNNRNK
ncbi:unnamed protein product [Pieris macdunnoughi]|uniref:RNase H type-1 domain-containing protein n=1 Tax=Pieris macdunnoughi TaxID=345717 RepID=A0A821Q287_9NEOP|nr:unnamed protein product [Pieris macdunnoughi]